MIRVRKPDSAPKVLLERGVALTEELCNKVDAGEPLRFDRDVYGAEEVKRALKTAQHDKCCFCESKLGHAQFGDVEHFRPKASAQQSTTDRPTMGYYWLAYTWKNLYLSCEVCNRRHKRGLFPLANPERRVSSHRRSTELDIEQPLFVDPGSDNPRAFIEFRREYAAPVAGSPRGAATIIALELNMRPELVERRRERHKLLCMCVIVVADAIRSGLSSDDPQLTIALEFIADAASERGEYSAMSRSLLHHVAPWRENWALPAASLLDALRADDAAGRSFRVAELGMPRRQRPRGSRLSER